MPITLTDLTLNELAHEHSAPVGKAAAAAAPVHLSSTDCIKLEQRYGAHK